MARALDITALLAADTLAVAASHAKLSLALVKADQRLSDRKKQWLTGLASSVQNIREMVEYLVQTQVRRLASQQYPAQRSQFLQDEQELRALLEKFLASKDVLQRAAQEQDTPSPEELGHAAETLKGILGLCEQVRALELAV